MEKLARGLIVLLCFLSTPAHAANLDIGGTFGNESGCHLAKGDFDRGDDSGIYLMAESHGGWEWSCSFSWISEGEDFGGEFTDDNGKTRTLFAWTVIALCGGEGMAWPEVFSIQDMGDTIAVASLSEPTKGPTVLRRCPPQ